LGIAFSLLIFIWRSAHPHTAELGYLEKEKVFRNLKRFPEAKAYPEAMILRVDASLYFANMAFLENRLRRGIEDRPDLRWIVLDLSGVNDMDAVAIETLEGIISDYQDRHIRFLFAGMKGPVRDIVARAQWGKKYGESVDYLSIQHALRDIGLMEKDH
jgi:SulP family sulfate permease